MGPKFKFTEGEKVLCFHGPLLYEAKCIKSQVKDKTIRYYIHYSGWNKNWDEWVPEARVLKHNDENVKKQKELANSCVNNKKTKAVKNSTKKEKESSDKDSVSSQEKPAKKLKESTSATSSPSITTTAEPEKKKKPRTEQNMESDESVTENLNREVKLPKGLKLWLLRSVKKIESGHLVKLPAGKSVEGILKEYFEHRKQQGLTLNQETQLQEIISGIRLYFNLLLKPLLLFNPERQQHTDLMLKFPDTKPSHLYGSLHLLRLFTKLGEVMSRHPYDAKTWGYLESDFVTFLKYLDKNSHLMFSTLNDFELVEKT